MIVAWKSATNCARSYQLALSKDRETPKDWKFSFNLKTEHVWDAFLILSLWEDHRTRQSTRGSTHRQPEGSLQGSDAGQECLDETVQSTGDQSLLCQVCAHIHRNKRKVRLKERYMRKQLNIHISVHQMYPQ
jgi:hypothetical protein